MRVYNVNKAVGLASSGVEYAQRYRREVFAGIPWVDDYYVFTDYMPTNVSVFTDPLGFARSQVLWIYNLVSGRETRPCTVSVEEFLATLEQPHAVAPRTFPDRVDVSLADSPVRYLIRTVGDERVDRVETVVGDQLVRVEHFDRTRNNVEHFHRNRLARRVFYTADGRIAAEQLHRDRGIVRTRITPASPLYERAVRKGRRRLDSFRGDLLIEGRSRFFQLVFEHLFSRADDVVIVDRALDVIDAIYPVIGDRRLYSIVHAEHFDLKQVEDGVVLWNNHYENVFTRPELVDAVVVSTERQKEVLEEQLARQPSPADLRVVRIPAGVVAGPAAQAEYDPLALVVAGRLADEKHLDILVRAVAAARERLPELRLDVYGEGDREGLLRVIEETGTGDSVRLMGHRELDGVLGSYALYATASTSEGFGLSLLEAIAAGLPIVGFDVDYGNREMVEPGVNGRLVPWTFDDHEVGGLADAIVETLTSGSLDDMRRASLRKAEGYTVGRVRERWERILGEGDGC